MNTFHVWWLPFGAMGRAREDGMENAKWLLDRLSQSFVFKTSKPFGETVGTSVCGFEVSYSPPLSRFKFERLLAAIPEVDLTTRPE